MQKEILLHVCCAPCAGSVVERLQKENWKVTLYWCNPNIFPQSEYEKRLAEVEHWAEKNKIEIIKEKESYNEWLHKVEGLTQAMEGGSRCQVCYAIRLEKTAEKAKIRNIPFFASTLTNSRHKRAEIVNPIGEKFAKKYGVEFLAQDWKKQGGELRSVEICREENFYRQGYCGCEFSMRREKEKE